MGLAARSLGNQQIQYNSNESTTDQPVCRLLATSGRRCTSDGRRRRSVAAVIMLPTGLNLCWHGYVYIQRYYSILACDATLGFTSWA